MLSSLGFASEISDVTAPPGFKVSNVSTLNDVAVYALVKASDNSHVYTFFKNSQPSPVIVHYQFIDGEKHSGPYFYHLDGNANLSLIPITNSISSNYSQVCITSVEGGSATVNKLDMNAPKGFSSADVSARNDVVIYVMIKDDDKSHLYTYYQNRNPYPVIVNYTFTNGFDDYGHYFFKLKENEKICKDPIPNDVPVAFNNVKITSVEKW